MQVDMQARINALPQSIRDRVGVAHETQEKLFFGTLRHIHVRCPSGHRRRLRIWRELGWGLLLEIRPSGHPALIWSLHYPWVDLDDVRKARRDGAL